MREIEPHERLDFEIDAPGPSAGSGNQGAAAPPGQSLVQGEIAYASSGIDAGSGFRVTQQLEGAEIVFGLQKANDYFVQPFQGGTTLRVTEDGGGFGGAFLRNLVGGFRTAQLDVLGGRDLVLWQIALRRRPSPFNRAEVRDGHGRLLGVIEQRFAWFGARYELMLPDGLVLATIHRPFYRWFRFEVSDGRRPIGTIEKQWAGLARELYTQADEFMVRIDESFTDVRVRRLLLCATIVIDLVHFERPRQGGLLGYYLAKRS